MRFELGIFSFTIWNKMNCSTDQIMPNFAKLWHILSLMCLAVQGVSSVQPDLLCGQNRFPQHLDNPLTLDVAGSAQSSVQHDDCVPFDVALPDTSHPGHLDFANFPDTDNVGLMFYSCCKLCIFFDHLALFTFIGT